MHTDAHAALVHADHEHEALMILRATAAACMCWQCESCKHCNHLKLPLAQQVQVTCPMMALSVPAGPALQAAESVCAQTVFSILITWCGFEEQTL